VIPQTAPVPGVLHTPDFFAIRGDTARWEGKTEEELIRLSERKIRTDIGAMARFGFARRERSMHNG
jgi:hypothetical protein